MILEQHYLACLAQASYLIADEEAGVAAVVDPRRDVDLYLERARELGCAIRHVLLTHFHADFVAGHLELARRAGATIHLGRAARAEYAFEPFGEGDRIELGGVTLTALETPGHTPEGICILVHAPGGDPARPHAVLTGDTLFVGDVGRPDLMASEGCTAEELAGRLYDSLHDKLLRLPDETRLYPGHGAGSMCGKNLSSETVSSIGAQRAANYALQPMERAEFVAQVTADQPTAPAYFAHDARLNRSERATLEELLPRALVPLSVEELLRHVNAGAQALDVRSPDDWATGHLVDSVNIGLEGKFATWAGTLLDLERPVVLIADPGREREAALRLARVGVERVAGYLDGGHAALAARRDLVRAGVRESVEAAHARLAGGAVLVDVRGPGEHEAVRVPASLHVPLPELAARAGELPRDRPLVLLCAGGYRSSIAASLLERAGLCDLVDTVGGMGAWRSAGLPTEVTAPAR